MKRFAFVLVLVALLAGCELYSEGWFPKPSTGAISATSLTEDSLFDRLFEVVPEIGNHREINGSINGANVFEAVRESQGQIVLVVYGTDLLIDDGATNALLDVQIAW